MASVRSMLRNERASRRIVHPHLTYSTTGTLICQICHAQIKTEALWKKHLASASHTTNLQRTREAASAAPALVEATNKSNGSKKRKADDDSSDDDTRKRTRAQDPSDSIARGEQGSTLVDSAQDQTQPTNDRKRKRSTETEESKAQHPLIDHEPEPNGGPAKPPIQPPDQTNNPINEDEWAAFQREVASPPPDTSAFTAAADISAAPMTAAELAAQSREQASRQAKERMEADLEGEKEDAARQMEEELDEMAELEDRVRRLREKRELLRVQRAEGKAEDGVADQEKVPPDEVLRNGAAEDDEGSHEDTDDDEDEWGVWRR
ncbi:MAG: hypothetical protein L6R42_002939 [Xanthoria sp. 1 TBL-2021]|nr:MAG: hypothetical protein L6R42_002939 [Xanthoria sp. 1 TBL-2021]